MEDERGDKEEGEGWGEEEEEYKGEEEEEARVEIDTDIAVEDRTGRPPYSLRQDVSRAPTPVLDPIRRFMIRRNKSLKIELI